jgi:hypothetical protein
MSSARVTAIAHRLQLRLTVSRRYSQALTGTAIDQSPRPGSRVTEGSALSVTLSDGPPPVDVPKVVGQSSASAQAALQHLKLRAAVTLVAAPAGVAPGTVARQSPLPGASRAPGSTVTLAVAEAPQWRPLTALQGTNSGRSVPFRIRGGRWQIVYSMGYDGTCTLLLFCSGPSASVVNITTGATVDGFGLGEGSGKTRTFDTGPGVYQIAVSPGSDTARWSIKIDDYY